MKKVSVSGYQRENVGRKDARRLRSKGLIPCVLYGGKEQIRFYAPEMEFRNVVYTPEACLIELSIDGREFNAVLQDIQFHPVSEAILHADFLEIFDDKPVKIDIPVKLLGKSPGVIKGGKLHLKLRKVKVEGLPGDLPDYIDVPISKLDIGDTFKVEQLKDEKLEFLDPANSVIVSVKTIRVVVPVDIEEEEDEEEEEAAPAPEE